MPLSDDQKAMLRLLARDQSYEDIAALMGLSVDEVVSRAQGAVAQLESEGIPAPALPEAPAGSAVSPPKPVEKAPEPAPPEAEPPPAPPAAPPPPKAPAAAAPLPRSAAPKQPRDKNKLLAIGGGVVGVIVIVVLAVLLISGSGGDGDDTTSASGGDTTAQTTANGERLEPTMAVLKPVDGGDASGNAVFGNLEEKLILAVEAKGLEPSAKGTQYAICIAAGPDRILPIASTRVGAKGAIEASVELPAELLLYLANETYSEIVITRANTARLAAEIKRQPKEPAYSGVPVLRGEITGSLVGNKELLKQVQEAKKAE